MMTLITILRQEGLFRPNVSISENSAGLPIILYKSPEVELVIDY